MTVERETKLAKLPVSELGVSLKAWITAREKREISSILLEGTTFDAKNNDFSGINPALLTKLQDKQIELVVISIGDKKEGLAEVALDLREEDFNFLMTQVEEIVNPIEAKKK